MNAAFLAASACWELEQAYTMHARPLCTGLSCRCTMQQASFEQSSSRKCSVKHSGVCYMSVVDTRLVCGLGSNNPFGRGHHEADKVMWHYPSSEMSAAERGCLADAERQLSPCFLSCRPVVLLLRCMYRGPRGLGGACSLGCTDIAQGEVPPALDAPCHQDTMVSGHVLY